MGKIMNGTESILSVGQKCWKRKHLKFNVSEQILLSFILCWIFTALSLLDICNACKCELTQGLFWQSRKGCCAKRITKKWEKSNQPKRKIKLKSLAINKTSFKVKALKLQFFLYFTNSGEARSNERKWIEKTKKREERKLLHLEKFLFPFFFLACVSFFLTISLFLCELSLGAKKIFCCSLYKKKSFQKHKCVLASASIEILFRAIRFYFWLGTLWRRKTTHAIDIDDKLNSGFGNWISHDFATAWPTASVIARQKCVRAASSVRALNWKIK